MVPLEKSKALSIYHSHDSMWTPGCVMELKNNFHFTLKEVASLHIYIWLALDHPGHIYRVTEDLEIVLPAVVSAVEKDQKAAVGDILMW